MLFGLSALARRHLLVSLTFLTRTEHSRVGLDRPRTLPLSSRNEDNNMLAGWVVPTLALHCYPLGKGQGQGTRSACVSQVQS